jgi:hypothetical protein
VDYNIDFGNVLTRLNLDENVARQGSGLTTWIDDIRDCVESGDNISNIKFTRNEIMTANEIRSIVGYKPSNDPKADQLVNSNIRQPGENQNTQNADNNFDVSPEENSDVTDELSLEDYKELGKEVLSGMTNE